MANSFLVPVSQAEIIKLAQQLGVSPDATSGVLPEQDGVKLSYVVSDGIGGKWLSFTVLKKPFYVSMDVIENHVKALIGD